MYGCTSELVPLLDKSSFFSKGFQSPFRFDSLSLPTLMHQRLRFLASFMNGCQDQVWVTLMPELSKVRGLLSFGPMVSRRLIDSLLLFAGNFHVQVGYHFHSCKMFGTQKQLEAGSRIPNKNSTSLNDAGSQKQGKLSPHSSNFFHVGYNRSQIHTYLCIFVLTAESRRCHYR